MLYKLNPDKFTLFLTAAIYNRQDGDSVYVTDGTASLVTTKSLTQKAAARSPDYAIKSFTNHIKSGTTSINPHITFSFHFVKKRPENLYNIFLFTAVKNSFDLRFYLRQLDIINTSVSYRKLYSVHKVKLIVHLSLIVSPNQIPTLVRSLKTEFATGIILVKMLINIITSVKITGSFI